MQSAEGYPAGALSTTPVARGTLQGRRVLVKDLREGVQVAGAPEERQPKPVDAARAKVIIHTGRMDRVRELDPALSTWVSRWTTFHVPSSGQRVLVEELRNNSELPEWLSPAPWSEIPEIELPADLFSR